MRIRDVAERFVRCERGTIAVLVSLSIFVLGGFVGLAFDGIRAWRAKTRIVAVLDAAALAGAKVLNRREASDAEVLAAIDAVITASQQDFVALWSTIGGRSVQVDRGANTVLVAIDVQVPTIFARLVGVTSLDFPSATKVAYRIQWLELAMVLDVTGSMNDGGKLDAMKASAGTVIDTLMATGQAADSVRIALAPFSAAVNTGSYNSRISQSVDGCVVERLGAERFTDASPGLGAVPAWFDPAVTAGSRYACPAAPIVPLTQDVWRLKSTIAAYTASGATAGHIGAAWGWYLLSPSWASVWPQSPGAYSDPNVVKAVIFLTDGMFNTSFQNGLTTPVADQTTESYAQFVTLCGNMRAAGLTIYTIGLDLGDATALAKLRECAGSSERAFEAPSASQLQGVFMQIIASLNSLRLVQ